MDQTPHAGEGLNLTTHRAPESVWARRGWDGSKDRLTITRCLVGIGGGALAIQGLRQGTWKGRMLAGLGGTLAWWALTGEGDLTDARRWFDEVLERAPYSKHRPTRSRRAMRHRGPRPSARACGATRPPTEPQSC
jgi:hypothetical protein